MKLHCDLDYIVILDLLRILPGITMNVYKLFIADILSTLVKCEDYHLNQFLHRRRNLRRVCKKLNWEGNRYVNNS